mmetsp:Transcript_5039/g.12982  ORF Transcript_5039/g.12982 Transcript_5039/m.12982 type:complete len:331 (+) Transcript_5039:526-1518(+)
MPSRSEMRWRTRCTTGSSRHDGTLHQEVELVRTGVTPSPASERSKLCPPLLTIASTSSSERKLSKATTHGSRRSTRAPCSAPGAVSCLKSASICPGRMAGVSSFGRAHRSSTVKPQVPHVKGHDLSMKLGLASHSAGPHTPHDGSTSWHSGDSHAWQARAHARSMKPGFASHSPSPAHLRHSECSLEHASNARPGSAPAPAARVRGARVAVGMATSAAAAARVAALARAGAWIRSGADGSGAIGSAGLTPVLGPRASPMVLAMSAGVRAADIACTSDSFDGELSTARSERRVYVMRLAIPYMPIAPTAPNASAARRALRRRRPGFEGWCE